MTAQPSTAREVDDCLSPSSPIARKLARFAAELSYDAIPAPVRDRAKYHVLDAVGNALASTHYDFSRRILESLRALGEVGTSTVIGVPHKLPIRDAALMNGALIHGLDYDDTHMKAIVHPSASALPCALAVSEYKGVSGRDLLAAYILGVEVAARLGIAAKGGFHHVGFHPTGVVAHFSCALAAGHLMHLDAAQLAMAQGIVVSTAAATHEFRIVGGWNKRIHPGWAAAAGITAAALARGGFFAPDTAYEGKFGLYKTHLGALEAQVDYEGITAALGDRWEAAEVAIKPFPVCHFIHACADAALAVRSQAALEAEDIRRVRVLIPKETIHIIAEPAAAKTRPDSSYQAKFSVQYSVAACLARGRLGLLELEDEARNDKQILSLAERVSVEADPDSQYPRYFSGGIVVDTQDGRVLSHYEPVNRGTGERKLKEHEIVDKFLENAELAVSRSIALQVRDAVLDMDRLPAMNFARALCAGC